MSDDYPDDDFWPDDDRDCDYCSRCGTQLSEFEASECDDCRRWRGEFVDSWDLDVGRLDQ